MRIGTMLSDILRGIVQPVATELYPFERREPPARLRGKLVWDPSSCIGCGLGEKDCPAEALRLIVIDKKAKRFAMRYHIDRCTFCAQCVQSCRQGCLQMDPAAWELAALDPGSFVIYYGEPENVHTALADQSADHPSPG